MCKYFSLCHPMERAGSGILRLYRGFPGLHRQYPGMTNISPFHKKAFIRSLSRIYLPNNIIIVLILVKIPQI